MKRRKATPPRTSFTFSQEGRGREIDGKWKGQEKISWQMQLGPSMVRITDEGPRHPKAGTWEALTAEPAAQSRAAAREPSQSAGPSTGKTQSSAVRHSWRLALPHSPSLQEAGRTLLQPLSLMDQDQCPRSWLTPRASPP